MPVTTLVGCRRLSRSPPSSRIWLSSSRSDSRASNTAAPINRNVNVNTTSERVRTFWWLLIVGPVTSAAKHAGDIQLCGRSALPRCMYVHTYGTWASLYLSSKCGSIGCCLAQFIVSSDFKFECCCNAYCKTRDSSGALSNHITYHTFSPLARAWGLPLQDVFLFCTSNFCNRDLKFGKAVF